MRIVTQAPTQFTVCFYPQLDFIGSLAIALSIYLLHWLYQRGLVVAPPGQFPHSDALLPLMVGGVLALLLLAFGISQVVPRLRLTTLILDQGIAQLTLRWSIGIYSRTFEYPLSELTGMHLVNRLGLAPHLRLWLRQGDRVQGKRLIIPAHLNLKELENIKKSVEFILIASGQQWFTTNFSQRYYQVSWYVTQTPTLLTITTDNPEYRIRFVADRVQRTLQVALYRRLPQTYPFDAIEMIQLEDDYLPSGRAIPWIRLLLNNGDRPRISQHWGNMGGYREIAKYLARFIKVDVQVL